MDYPYTLKHLSRSPLPLDRVPSHLCVEIILKQSVHSIFNLLHTNSRCAVLVEAALSSNPNVAIIQEILTKIDKDEVLGQEPCYSTYYLTDLWAEQRRHEPRRVSLQSLPDGLWGKILAKTAAVSAIRLIKTNSTATAAFDDYVESVLPIWAMVQSAPLANQEEKWGELKVRGRPIGYHESSLFKAKLVEDILWPTKKKRSWKKAEIVADKLEEKQRGLEQLMKNSGRYDLLGQTLIPSKKPEVNEELLHFPKHI